MLKVSVRDFQLNAKEYLNKLPITLTRYNKDIAVLKSASDIVDKISTDYIKVAPQVVEVIGGEQMKCDMQFCKSQAIEKRTVPLNDGMGGTKDTEMNLCKFHLHKFDISIPQL
jgi:hypothetical protein